MIIVGADLEIQTKAEIFSKKMFYYFICLLWMYETLFRYVSIVLSRLPYLGGGFLYYFRPIVLILLLASSLPYFFKRLNVSDVIYTIAVMLFVCITVLVNSRYNQEFINSYLWTFVLQCFPMIFVGRIFPELLYDDKKIRFLGLLSLLCLISTILVILQSGANIQADWSGSMYYPYIMLPHLLCLFFIAVNYSNIIYLIVFILGFVFMAMLGNRGSLVCTIVFVIVCLFKYFVKLSFPKKVISIIIFGAIILFFVEGRLYNALLLNIYNFANQHGLSTRLFYFINGDIDAPFDSGRSILREKVIAAIFKNPLGYGLSSDVYFAGAYVHNIFLELLVEFGVIFGSILIVALVLLIVKVLVNRNIEWKIKNVFWLFICASLIKLLISGTYLTDPYVYFMIGMGLTLKNIFKIDDEEYPVM